MRWYKRAGTPIVKVKGHYDSEARTYTLKFIQESPSNFLSDKLEPFHIPIAMGLLGKEGPLTLSVEGDSSNEENKTHLVLELTETEQSFVLLT